MSGGAGGVVGGPVTFPGYPPGPPTAKHLLERLRGLDDLRRDVLGTVGQRFATYGDFYYGEGPDLDIYFTCHPELIHEVLVTQARAFHKRTLDLEVLGNGLLTSDGRQLDSIEFSHFLVRDEEPLLFHTGLRGMFPALREDVAKLIDPAKIRWIGFSHFESDECGA